MGRTNVVIDDELIARVMQMYDLRSKREAVDFALRELVGELREPRDMLKLRGSRIWRGDLDEMRASQISQR